jgi:hypothetical protein
VFRNQYFWKHEGTIGFPYEPKPIPAPRQRKRIHIFSTTREEKVSFNEVDHSFIQILFMYSVNTTIKPPLTMDLKLFAIMFACTFGVRSSTLNHHVLNAIFGVFFFKVIVYVFFFSLSNYSSFLTWRVLP